MKALLSLLYVITHHNSTQPKVDNAVTSNHKTVEMTEDYESRIEVINAIIFCLRESHKSRTIFRRVGGFVYIVSVLMSMEGCLSPKNHMMYKRKDEEKCFPAFTIRLHLPISGDEV
jgi:hypothetical protein